MATKSRKKSSKKMARKTAKKTAQVELDPSTVLQFEAYLRQGLVASGAILMSAETPQLRAGARVHLDSDAIQKVSEILRDGLVSSAAVLATELPQPMKPARKTSRSKKKAARKGGGRAVSKKR